MTKFNARAMAVAVSIAFSAGAAAQGLSKADYTSARDGITAEHKAAQAACASLSGNAKDICKADAKGKRNVARAELEERNKPGKTSHYDVNSAKAKAAYAVAREKCDDLSAGDKKACVQSAKADEARAIASARAEMKSAHAGTPAKAVPVAAAATGSKQENPGEYIDDSVITAKVKAVLFDEPSLKSTEINVETYKGIVQLSGFVRSRADINKAVEVAGRVKGVASIKNVMIVKGQQ